MLDSDHNDPSPKHRSTLIWTFTTISLLSVMYIAAAGRSSSQETSLLAESVAIGPGSTLELQTSQGPMMLTVDSPMNQAGYVHAYGLKNGVEYAGFVKLTSAGSPISEGQSYSQAISPQYSQQYQPMYSPGTVVAGQQLAASPDKYLTLSIAPDGTASLDGEKVIASNPRTASVLRLLAKKNLPQINFMPARDPRVDSEISRVKALLSRLEAEKQTRIGGARRAQSSMLAMAGSDVVSAHRSGRRRGDDSRRAMYADMQSLMKSVSRIERKENRMEKVVDKVKKIMRYKPF